MAGNWWSRINFNLNQPRKEIGVKNTEYRSCKSSYSNENDCVFCSKNEYGVDCCTIDRIVQVTHYGCIPQEVINKQDKEWALE